MHDEPSNPYLDALTGERGLAWRAYALGGTCLLVFLLALALFSF